MKAIIKTNYSSVEKLEVKHYKPKQVYLNIDDTLMEEYFCLTNDGKFVQFLGLRIDVGWMFLEEKPKQKQKPIKQESVKQELKSKQDDDFILRLVSILANKEKYNEISNAQ